MKPYYERSGITLYLGDCREILPTLKADICITDPPYNAGKNYGKATNDRQEWPEWAAWMDQWLGLGLAAARDGVLCFLSQTAYKEYLRRGQHDPFWTAVWNKPLSMAVCAAPFLPHWEPIAYFGPKRKKKGSLVWGSDVLSCNVEFGASRWGHPTPKPIKLMRDLVVRTEGVVLDPFAGSGTTLRAAKDLGREAIGIEINETYCETIARRLEQEVLALDAFVMDSSREVTTP